MFIDLHPKFDSILIDILISTIDMAYVLYDSSLLRKLYNLFIMLLRLFGDKK